MVLCFPSALQQDRGQVISELVTHIQQLIQLVSVIHLQFVGSFVH